MVGSKPDSGTPEIQRLDAQAQALRQQFAHTRDALGDIVLKQRAATRAAENAKADATEHAEWAAASRKAATQQLDEAQRLDAQAAAAEAEGRKHDAEELREQAADEMAKARENTRIAGRENELADEARVAENRANAEHESLTEQRNAFSPRHDAAEKAIDAIEDKARNLRMAELAQSEVDDLNRQANELRASGDTAGAAGLASAIRDAEVWRDSVRAQADAIVVDEAALTAAGLDPTKPPEPASEPTEVSDAADTGADPTLGLDGESEPAPDSSDLATASDTGADTAFADESGLDAQPESAISDPTLDDPAAAADASAVATSEDYSADYTSDYSASPVAPDDSVASDFEGSDGSVG